MAAFFVVVDFLLEVDFAPVDLELDAFFFVVVVFFGAVVDFFVVALVAGFLVVGFFAGVFFVVVGFLVVVVFFRGVGFPASSASILSNSSISF